MGSPTVTVDWRFLPTVGLLTVRVPPEVPALLVSAKVAAGTTGELGKVAVTLYGPEEPFAVMIGVVTRPFELVTSVTVFEPPVPAKVRLAPEAGAVKVTCMPLSRLFWASRTTACNWDVKVVRTTVDCPPPATGLTVAGVGALIVIDRVTVKVRRVGAVESVTVMDALVVPSTVGVPEIIPVDAAMVKPAGRPVAAHVYGEVPPVATTVAE